MTISTTGNQVSFTGDGASTNFAFPYPFITTTDLKVFVNGVAVTTGFSVAGIAPANGPGTFGSGTVTFTTPPASGAVVLIYCDPDQLQSTSLPPNDPFPSKTMEKALDKLTLLIQRIIAKFGNALLFPSGDTTNGTLPVIAVRANNALGFDANGLPIAVSPLPAGTLFQFGVPFNNQFTPNGTGTTYALTSNPGLLKNLDVWVGGVKQRNGIDFTWSSATPLILTSTSVWPADAPVEVEWTQALPIGTVDPSQLGFLGLSTGASLIGFQQAGLGAVLRTLQQEIGVRVTPWQFGAKGGGFDDKDALAAAFTYAIGISKKIWIEADFSTSVPLTIAGSGGLTIYGAGNLIGIAVGAQESVLTIKNIADVTIAGRLGVGGSYNTNYAAGVAIYTDNVTAAQVMNLNLTITGAQVGARFGRTTEPEGIVSELMVQGLSTFGCPIGVEVIGFETVVNFIGCTIRSDLGANPVGWSALPRIGIHVIGGAVIQTAGELLLTDVTTGAGVKVEPIIDATNGNQYGSFVDNGVAFECASQYVVVANPNAIGSLVAGRGLVQFVNCIGAHTQNAFTMVAVAADYPGRIVFQGNNFYATVARTQPNITCAGTLCDVYVDDQSFGNNFQQGLVAFQGGMLHFTDRLIAQMSGCSGAVAGAGVKVPLAWASYTNTQDTQRYSTFYVPGTGIFTVPPGGLKSVRVVLVERVTGITQVLDASIYINGTATNPAMTMLGGASASGWIRLEASLGDLAAGTTIQGAIFLTGAASTFNGAGLDSMSIFARN